MRVPQSLSPLFEAGNVGWTMLGLAVLLLALAVVVLARLRWIQSRPLAACVVLSVFAHVLLISAVHLTRMFDIVPPPGDAGIAVRLADPVAPPSPPVIKNSKQPDPAPLEPDQTPVMPWEKLAVEPSPPPTMTPVPPLAAPSETEKIEPLPPAPIYEQAHSSKPLVVIETAELTEAKPAAAEDGWKEVQAPAEPPDTAPAAAIAAPSEQTKPLQQEATEEIQWRASTRETTDVPEPESTESKTPPRYRARTAANREQIVQRRGGSPDTEAAVARALDWLVANQSADGRWDASAHAAGHGQLVEGHFRGAAGVQADTGITGLALLALLGAGHTHEHSPKPEHRAAVASGLTFLMREQAADGNMSGAATRFARMYCHGIASLALCEALAMTGDERLRPHTEQAIRYTLHAQHPTTGGWRYHPGDSGDLSQFGWQVMALTSAEQAGVAVPLRAKQGMHRFLNTATSGSYHGLASYRPGTGVSRPMTAEALACRAFLGQDDDRLTDEASRYIAGAMPGRSAGVSQSGDLYFWYYATLGLHLSGADAWQSWNTALSRKLLATQVRNGNHSGSWEPNTKWAGHGGRVYSTALSAMCLEVYYRYAN